MKKSRLILILPFFSLLFFSCEAETEIAFERVKVKQGYSLEVTNSMIPSKSLNAEASLQYFDESRQLFVIVLDEEKEAINAVIAEDEELSDYYSQDLTGFSELVMDNFAYQMDVQQAEQFKDTIIQNYPTKTFRLVATLEDVEIFYSLAFVEGERNYYRIWTWTMNELVSENLDLMQHMLFSFKEERRR